MNQLYAGLQWLPRPSSNLSQTLKALDLSSDSLGATLQSIAGSALDLNALTRLARVITKAHATGGSLHSLTKFKLAILSNATIDMIVPALVATAARYGVDLEVIKPSYDQVAQEALTPTSQVNSSKPDAVLFAIDFRALPLRVSLGDSEAAANTVAGSLGYLTSLRDGIKANCNALCIFQTFVPPAELLFGSLDRSLPGSLRFLLDAVNRELGAAAREKGDVLLDVASLAETVGLAEWHDPSLWNMGKFPFNDALIPLYADHVCRIVAAIRGKSRKVLVLDLDNTVWGGVIGDDGLEGIQIAQGDARGEAHLAVQRLALELRQRGVILAVSSKNTDAIAREPFEKHPEMLLKLDHIAVFQANWNDKATNLRAIADELSVGIDSLVFLDDNPVERGLVRQLLPQVAVPELPEDPALYARILAAAGYFESPTFAVEDLQRAGFYQDNARRAGLKKQVGGVDAYLASLEMTITFQPFDATGRARIVQLINKSNQFNLTTRRYTDPEVRDAEADPQVFTLQVRLTDIFGDNGMIGVIICLPGEPGTWEIDTWLMSCRVLGRKVEHVTLGEILRHARAAGIKKLVGVYLPTDRNSLVAEHYSQLGFTSLPSEGSGASRWELFVDTAEIQTVPMEIRSLGFVEEQAAVV